MKCPHCEYEAETEQFYCLVLHVRRVPKPSKADLYGCPECSKTFIIPKEELNEVSTL